MRTPPGGRLFGDAKPWMSLALIGLAMAGFLSSLALIDWFALGETTKTCVQIDNSSLPRQVSLSGPLPDLYKPGKALDPPSDFDSIDIESRDSCSVELPLFYNQNPALLLWAVLASAAVGIGIAAAALVIVIWRSLSRRFGFPAWHVPIHLALMAGLGVLTYLATYSSQHLTSISGWLRHLQVLLVDPVPTIHWVAIPIFGAALLALWGQVLVAIAAKSIGAAPPTDAAQVLDDFDTLRGSLKVLLVIVSLLLVLGILVTSAMRQALLAAVEVSGLDIGLVPMEFIYMYGLYFAVILGIFYVPIFMQLRLRGVHLLHELEAGGNLEPDDEDSRTRLTMRESPLSNLISTLSIFAPLITSFLPGLLKAL